MKKCLILLASIVMLAACTQDAELSIAPDLATFQFDADGGSFDAVIFTNGHWKATCDDPAVTFTPDSADFTAPMHIVVGPNEEHHTKSIRISLTSKLDNLSRTSKIAITQACRPFIISEETILQAPAAGGEVRFHVNANDSWKVVETTCDGEATTLAVDPLTSGPNSVEVTVRIPENTTGRARTFTVTLALESWRDCSVVLTVAQGA